jgi:hypothetical protein
MIPLWKPRVKAVPVIVSNPIAAVAEPEPDPVIEPTKRWRPTVTLSKEEATEYESVANTLGILANTALVKERLARCLRDNNLECYADYQVVRFLNAKLGKGKWCWAGLRQCDVDHLRGWSTGESKIPFADKQYGRAVPLPALLTVKAITEAMPEVYFYVSESKAENEDPFLLVTNRDLGQYIVERWDEPDFRER